MLEVLLGAEQCAVKGYTHICDMTFGKDPRTYDFSLAILHKEIEHEAWFSEFLGHKPSGHYSRYELALCRQSSSMPDNSAAGALRSNLVADRPQSDPSTSASILLAEGFDVFAG